MKAILIIENCIPKSSRYRNGCEASDTIWLVVDAETGIVAG